MPVLPHLTTANTVGQMMTKVNQVIDVFDTRDSAAEIVFVPNGTVTANNVQGAVQQVNVQANTKINNVSAALVSNVAMLNTSINNSETRALASAVALAIALG